jgi:MerR family copper efflux transcriptional regulator
VESQVAAAGLLKIGEVSARSGLTVKTIRFYCDEGLIHPVSRTGGGFRLFSPDVFAELTFIRTLRALEIPLPDVLKILESRRCGVCTCASLQHTIETKAGEIEAKISALHQMHVELLELLNDWQDCGGRKG